MGFAVVSLRYNMSIGPRVTLQSDNSYRLLKTTTAEDNKSVNARVSPTVITVAKPGDAGLNR